MRAARAENPVPVSWTTYLRRQPIDPARSAVIGDRGSDLALAANLKIRGLTVCRDGAPDQTWPSVLEALTARHATVVRQTKETRIDVRVNLDREIRPASSRGSASSITCSSSSPSMVALQLELMANGDLQVDEHHTVEDSALALGDALRQALRDKRGIARYGFVLPMDEAQVASRARPVRSTVLPVRGPLSPRHCRRLYRPSSSRISSDP